MEVQRVSYYGRTVAMPRMGERGWQFFLQIDPLVQIINVISVVFIYVDILIAASLVAIILTEIVIFDSKVLL